MSMYRRTFLKWLGLAPLLSLVAKIPEPKQELALEKLTKARLLLDSNEVPEADRWFAVSNKTLSKIHRDAFTEELERQGKMTFTETVDVMPNMAHCIQIRHIHHGEKPLDRITWIDSEDDFDASLAQCRAQTKIALRRWWAQQIRWKRKAHEALVRV